MLKKGNKNHTHAKMGQYGWYIHLLIFVMAQLIFFVFDDVTGWKNIFNLTAGGDWVISKLSPIWEWFHLYNKPQFNLITVIWGLILIIGGLIRIFGVFRYNKENRA